MHFYVEIGPNVGRDIAGRPIRLMAGPFANEDAAKEFRDAASEAIVDSGWTIKVVKTGLRL